MVDLLVHNGIGDQNEVRTRLSTPQGGRRRVSPGVNRQKHEAAHQALRLARTIALQWTGPIAILLLLDSGTFELLNALRG